MGDSTNDLTMIRAAGLGLVMENGMQELKAVADRVICNNREHAVAWLLKEYFA
jgi:hydroxymethylpyrimidine pyrophosphatase-like HAD family hydrolase